MLSIWGGFVLILKDLRKTFKQEKLSGSWEELRTVWEGIWIQEPLFKWVTLSKSLSRICGIRMITMISATQG